MALTENQKELARLMHYTDRSMPETMKAYAEMSDEDALTTLAAWVADKQANPATPQGLIAQIAALEE